jgi:hypothetical protein
MYIPREVVATKKRRGGRRLPDAWAAPEVETVSKM